MKICHVFILAVVLSIWVCRSVAFAAVGADSKIEKLKNKLIELKTSQAAMIGKQSAIEKAISDLRIWINLRR
ncbi:MAG: hypothetical protein A3G33_04495 [Omnitrophica bacterium RIFCSPLOWO2_12_FULL_44_17]|uniref:YbgF trimerisation domain-containing protein n=1 Tax=Candidatus Danuiimicrobium aquiferis TaxID=1801832 RepID=A0A1G1KQG2_9BACT|nr:MAG: hypothetical protein A3B72_10705 [Omnitrophica bacterium RIFCSPHIGHO2_02_FULL_45_28]OGW95194.1 MAG: hypothetical protein A3G33_04495 [Omnitrophica bacterium RIFCSPLOWO2_12_FULL_44_17]OGX01661.1 MAG: hypothetical protein A3J12_03940 [Omnitrophica bacterium RIFCSPLOWO2_02_FULL_44_11]